MREFLRKVQLILLLALGTFPVVLTLFAYASKPLLPYAWMFPGAYAALALLSLALRGKWRIAWGILGAAALVVPCVMLLDDKAVAMAAGYGALLLWSLQIGGWEPEQELPGLWVGILAAIQLLAQVMLWLLPAMQPYKGVLTAVFFLFAALLLLSLNRGSLNMASGLHPSVSQVMRNKNILLTAGLFAGALLFALIPSMLSLLKLLWYWLIRLWILLQGLFASDEEPSATQAETEGVIHDIAEGVTAQQSPQWLYAVMLGVAAAVAIPLAIFVLVKLGKKAARLLRRWLRAFVQGASAQSEDYEDEITDTRDASARQRAVKVRKRRRRIDERTLTPGQRVRLRYGQLLEKNPAWGPGSTARENLPPKTAQVYERARYSSHPITPEEAERFKAETK